MIQIVFLCIGMCLGAIVTIVALERFRSTVLKGRIQELENEMLCSHAEILKLEREMAAILYNERLGNTG
jgi:hypothetical protein